MPYFSQYVIEELPKIVSDPEAVKHLRVYTTIDPDLQRAAYNIVNKRLEKLEKYFPKKPKGSLQAALVAVRPKTGEIVAMVGGRNFLENQFNRATDAQRQPGSVFKPFVYATAINTAYEGNTSVFTTASLLKDEKKIFTFGSDTYAPNNYGDTFSNKEISLRDALVKSKNTITVDLGMQLNIGKVMNFAHKAGLPKVEKAYPSMALGTAEATPLQIATGYTVFANLGDKVAPMPISRVTTGDGRTVVAPNPDRKSVLRPDVAYIMNDVMKDVINRGTASEAQAWGIKNVEGKQAFAGKTGTSRDGWFAGFTPEIVCVVYVGFDDGDDLGMKGSDSAMPIWADFIREALATHPEWNADWSMPVTVRKAEIDARNGTLIRELNDAEAQTVKLQQAIARKNTANADSNLDSVIAPAVETAEIYVSQVPAEFRRVELFVSGTVPNKALLPTGEEAVGADISAEPKPTATATPFTTWQEQQIEEGSQANTSTKRPTPPQPVEIARTITIMICPLTGMRATSNCPNKQPETFDDGEEPEEFCTFHVKPR
jgi:membrane peptidoglycan carboxypeptidase